MAASISQSFPVTPHNVIHEAIATVAQNMGFDTDLDATTGEIHLDPSSESDMSYFTVTVKDYNLNETVVDMRGPEHRTIYNFITAFGKEMGVRTANPPIQSKGEGRAHIRSREPLVSPSRPERQSAPLVELATEEKKSRKNWPIRILGACAMAWLFLTDDGKQFLDSMVDEFTVETNVAKYNCDMVYDRVKGLELKNLFGGQFKIVKVTPGKQLERTSTSLSCSAEVLLDNGISYEAETFVRQGSSSSEVLYGVQPIGM